LSLVRVIAVQLVVQPQCHQELFQGRIAAALAYPVDGGMKLLCPPPMLPPNWKAARLIYYQNHFMAKRIMATDESIFKDKAARH